MANIIKYKALQELIESYELEYETNKDESVNHKNEGEIEYLGKYALIDVTKDGVNFERNVPITRIEGNNILYQYENYFDKKHIYIIIDENGKHAAFICSILKNFGYKSIYLSRGFHGFNSWYQKNKKIKNDDYDNLEY